MAPYRYESYHNPYVGSIGELLAHQNDAAARAAEIIGAANARAAEQSGNAWAGAANNIGQIVGNLPGQIAAARRSDTVDQLNQLKLQEAQRGVAGQRAVAGLMQGDQLPAGDAGPRQESFLSADGLFDVGKITHALGQSGYGDMAHELVKGAESINDSILKHQDLEQKIGQAHTVLLGDMADGAIKLAKVGMPLLDAMDFVVQPGIATKRIDPKEYGQVRQQIASMPPEQQQQALTSLMDQAAKIRGVKTLAKDAQEVDAYGRVTASNVVPEKPTEATIALDAAKGDPNATKAMSLLKPAPPPRPIEEQLLEAIATGDKQKADQITQTLRATAEARRDPAAAAMARELGGLRADEARARLDGLQKKNAPLDIEPDIQTTVAGRTYVDISGYTGDERNKARAAANTSGAIPVSKEQANALQEIDNARMNQHAIMDQIGDLLPKGTAGRGVAAVAVPLEKLFQTNDQVAAFNTWRTSAIQTLRATAGSKGLRINQTEIAQAIENDIPKLTDTVGTAQQKLKNIETMLENAEKSILVRNRSVAPPSLGPPTPPTLTPGLLGLAGRK